MYDFPVASYESLKASVLLTSEQTAGTPVDCELLKQQIFTKTGIDLGPSVLLQVYGQKASLFYPSLFTLNTMADYQEGLSWKDWCLKCNVALALTTANLKWQLLKEKAGKVSAFTLTSLTHAAGSPQPTATIDKIAFAKHFGDTSRNVQLLTLAFGDPVGVALRNWIENTLSNSNDVQVLFFSGKAYINVFLREKDLLKWVLALIGYTEHLNLFRLLNDQQLRGKFFYLVIQDLDSNLFTTDQFAALTDQITEVVDFFKEHQWFKLIVTAQDLTQAEISLVASDLKLNSVSRGVISSQSDATA